MQEFGITPLLAACESGFHDIVKVLLTSGGDVNLAKIVSGDSGFALNPSS